MKKTIIFLIISICCGLEVSAQKFVVYSMLGKITVPTKKGIRPLELRETVSPNTTIIMPYDGELVLFDQVNKKKHTITTSGKATIAQFFKDSRNRSVGLSKAVLAAMVKRITSKGETILQTVEDNITITRDTTMVSPNEFVP